MKKINLKKLGIILLAIFILLQFLPTDRSVEERDPALSLFNSHDVPEEAAQLLKHACNDCHSDYTKYPWYSSIQPVGRWMQGHIDHAREKLNFSDWNSYSEKRKNHKIEECIEEIKAGSMPVTSYKLMHSNARLNDDEKQILLNFFQSLQ